MERGSSPPPLALIIAIFAVFLPGTRGLEVLSIEGPSVVVNGSASQLVLDCAYDFNEHDKTSLVVKWYFNRQPYPVYQWIPHNEPQDLGMLKGRVNLQYRVSEDEYSQHRALAILNPTTELSGEYTCWISSFEEEDFKRKDVIVYAPASDMSMTYTKPRDDNVIVSCRAGGIYPAPNIAIYRSSSSSRRAVIEGARVESQHFSDLGYFNISVELEAYDFELDSETMFECVLTIPDTEYKLQEKIVYFPGPPTTTSTTTTTTTTTATTTTTTTTTSAPLVELEGEAVDDEGDADDKDSEEGAKPHVAESVAGAGTATVRGGSLAALSSLLLLCFQHLRLH